MDTNQQIGLIGLGKMGFPLALNLRDNGFEVVAYDIDEKNIQSAQVEQIKTAHNLEDLLGQLKGPRVIWIMIPSGKPVDMTINQLSPQLQAGDILIDGGNSNFKDSKRRYLALKEKGIHLLDCGTSGGVSGARNGVCIMIGGEDEPFAYCEPLFKAIAVENGYLHTGAPASGHFTKMVHNGIEYGMMQAIAEGFEIMHESEFDLDYEAVAKVWNHGSVIRSWLIELMENAFSDDAQLDKIRGVMNASGEGLWTVETALEIGVPAPVIALSLMMRQRSQRDDTFSGKVVAALRNQFGGHAVVEK